jgi:hypothetical protein
VTIRVGDREVIKVRPFVRIATNLSLTSGLYATDIPPSSAALFSEENNEKVIAEAAPESRTRRSRIVQADLAAADGRAERAGLSDEDVAAQIEEEAAPPRSSGWPAGPAAAGQLSCRGTCASRTRCRTRSDSASRSKSPSTRSRCASSRRT